MYLYFIVHLGLSLRSFILHLIWDIFYVPSFYTLFGVQFTTLIPFVYFGITKIVYRFAFIRISIDLTLFL